MPAKGHIDSLVQQKATQFNIEAEQLLRYTAHLDWVRENGVLVAPHVYGTQLLVVSASLAELGIKQNDPRAKGLKGLRREFVSAHICAHYYDHQPGRTILCFSPDLAPPPSCFFDKIRRLSAVEFLTSGGEWTTLPAAKIYQLDVDDDSGFISKWLDLSTPEGFEWPVVEQSGQQGRWLRLTWKYEENERIKVTDSDITVAPINNLSTLEGKARASVDMNNTQGVRGYGQKLVGYGGYAWIGVKAWAAWQNVWNRYVAEMECIRAYILWRYSEFKAIWVHELSERAETAWAVLKSKRGDKFVVVLVDGGEAETKKQFVTALIKRGLDKLPSPERIEKKLRLDYEVAMVLSQGDIERDRLAAEKARTEQSEEIAQQRASGEWARVEEHRAWVEQERINTEHNAMKMAAMQKAYKQIEETGSPLQQMVDNLRSIVHQKMAEAQIALKEKGRLHPRQVQGLRRLVEQFDLLNSHDDDLETRLREFEEMMPAGRGVVSTDNLEDIVSDIVVATKKSAERVLDRDVADDYGTRSVRW